MLCARGEKTGPDFGTPRETYMKNQPTQADTIADIAARCDRPDQFSNFDRAVQASLSVSKEAVLKEEARQKKSRARRRAKKSEA